VVKGSVFLEDWSFTIPEISPGAAFWACAAFGPIQTRMRNMSDTHFIRLLQFFLIKDLVMDCKIVF
jgi:hypothetical protein